MAKPRKAGGLVPNADLNKAAETVEITDLHADLRIATPSFYANPGEYHMIQVGPNGEEIPGTDFSISERTYKRSYANRTDFKVKKKPKQ